MTIRLYVGNLAPTMNERKLEALFSRIGKVDSVVIPPDPEGKQNEFAFVEMENQADADEALGTLNGKEIDGRKLIVNNMLHGTSEHTLA